MNNENRENNEIKKKKNKFISLIRNTKIIIPIITILSVIILVLSIVYSSFLSHRETVLNFGFKDVGVLVTQEWYGRILEDNVKDRKLFNKIHIPYTNSRLIFSEDVEVLAGINFEDIKYKYDENKKIIKITLPKSYVYKYYKVPNSHTTYLDDESLFSNINDEERAIIEDAVVEKGKQQALDAGLLVKANTNAKKIVKQMVKSVDKEIEIKWIEN